MAVIAKQRYKLDIAPRGGWVIVYASQHDDGAREIEFEITNQGKAFSIPALINVSVQGIKSNTSYFSHSCSYSGNVVTMALADDMTDIVGKAICVLKFTNSSEQKLATAKFILNVDSDSSSEGVIIDTEAEEIFNQMLNEIRAQASAINVDIAEFESEVESTINSLIGSAIPPISDTVADFDTDISPIWVYVGSEDGYIFGNWYYYNGSAWVSGGVYASGITIDSTFTQEGQAADAKAVGDLRDDFNNSTSIFREDITAQLVNGYIAVGNVDIGSVVNFAIQSGGYKTNKYQCKKGDTFIISGYLNANAPRLWAFTDTQQILLSKSENKITLDNKYLVAPSDGYAVFSFQSGSEYELFKMVVKTDNTLSEVGTPADAKAVGDANKRKQQVFFAYSNGLTWNITNGRCYLTVNNTIRVRFDITDATVDTTKEAFLAIASASSLVTVSNGVVSGTHFAVVFDFNDNTIKILDTSTRSTFVNTAILFYYHYDNIGGILVNNKAALDTMTNAANIADIQEQIGNSLENYFESEAMTCRDEMIAACDEKAFVIAFTTDNHFGASNGMNFPTTVKTIKRVNELYQLDMVVDGGDLINGDETKTNAINRLTSAVNMLIGTGRPAYTLVGNHDDDSFTASELPLFSKAELYAMMYRHEGINLDYIAESEQYGYKDFDQYGLRVIFLDSMQGANGHVNADWGYSDAELAWFANDALDTQNQVVIFSHMGFTKEYSAYNYQVKNGAEMRQAVETFISNGGVCVGLFHGHTHWDFIGQFSQTNGFHEVATGCGRIVSGPITNRTDYYPSGATMPERTDNMVTQELWDIIVIKPDSREVDMIRYGAGSNRNFVY